MKTDVKYVDVKHHFIRDKFSDGMVNTVFVQKSDN